MLRSLLHSLAAWFRSRTDLTLEILALRQQLAVLKARRPRPRLSVIDRMFWIALRRRWHGWRRALIIVQPETVIGWHRRGFRAFWRWRSRPKRPGRPRLDAELRQLICRMARENPWGAPRIHAELQMLGFDLAQSTVSKYLPKPPTDPDAVRRWKIFLKLHREALVGMDFFTVPTVSFQVLHVLFFVHHHRRRVVHWAVTRAPSTEWIRQQLREAFPFDSAPRCLILDRDALFSADVRDFLRALGTTPVRISPRSPWQNGIAEQWVGSVRRELLDHVVVLDDRHLHRLVGEYVAYYHEDRPHLALGKDTSHGRTATPRPIPNAVLIAEPKVGGLHHRYGWQAAA